jgi:ribonuclease
MSSHNNLEDVGHSICPTHEFFEAPILSRFGHKIKLFASSPTSVVNGPNNLSCSQNQTFPVIHVSEQNDIIQGSILRVLRGELNPPLKGNLQSDYTEFRNYKKILPRLVHKDHRYREYTVMAMDWAKRGKKRIVYVDKGGGNKGTFYYSLDHYKSFVEIDLGGTFPCVLEPRFL